LRAIVYDEARFFAIRTRFARLSTVTSAFMAKSIHAAARMLYVGFVPHATAPAMPDKRAMDVTEFEDLIDRLGDDLTRWPEGRRLAAETLLAASAEAPALLDQAKILRQMLSAPPVRAPIGLTDRIMAAASQVKAEIGRAHV